MEEKSEKRNILIVSGYHSQENFAVGVGELLLEKNRNPRIKVVRYAGKPDKNSTHHLRRFIEMVDLSALPVVLHDDEEFNKKLAFSPSVNAIIIYYAKSDQEKKKVRKPLFDFLFKYNKKKVFVIFDLLLIHNAKQSLVEIELNPEMGLKKATALVNDFSEYFLGIL